jgi:hypothetical protein
MSPSAPKGTDCPSAALVPGAAPDLGASRSGMRKLCRTKTAKTNAVGHFFEFPGSIYARSFRRGADVFGSELR